VCLDILGSHRQKNLTVENPAEHLYPPKANSALRRNDDGGIRDLARKRTAESVGGLLRNE